jgi:hypothetical protein
MTDTTTPATTTDPVAKPWYTSVVIVSIVASMLLNAATKLGLLVWLQDLGLITGDITAQRVTAWIIVAAPAAVAIWGRFRANHLITGSAKKAAVINATAADKAA